MVMMVYKVYKTMHVPHTTIYMVMMLVFVVVPPILLLDSNPRLPIPEFSYFLHILSGESSANNDICCVHSMFI